MAENPTVHFSAVRDVVVAGRDLPKPAANELLIRTTVTAISTGTELAVLDGNAGYDSRALFGKLPFDPGYNNVGIVERVGENVDSSWIGRRVATYGKHAAWTVCRVDRVRPVPDNVADEHAVFFTFAEIAMNGVRRAAVQWGECAVVFGLGLIGQMATRLCAIAGCDPVFAVDISPQRLALLPEVSGVVAVNSSEVDVQTVVRDATASRMADVAFEVTGIPQLIEGETGVLRKQGRFILLSSPRGPSTYDFHAACNSPSLTIIGAHNGSHPPESTLATPWSQLRHAELFFRWLEVGRIDVAPLISHRMPAADAVAAYRMLLEDRTQAMGVLLDWRE